MLYLFGFGFPSDFSSSYYWRLSESLLRFRTLGFEGVPSTAFELLYPFFLAVARRIAFDQFPLVILFQSAFCSVGCIFFFRLCRWLTSCERVAWIGALLFCFHPYLIRQSSVLIEVSVFTTFLILFSYFLSKAESARGFIGSGILLGLNVLTRAAILPLEVFVTLILFLRRRFIQALLLAASSFLVVLPFSLRNYLLDGSWILTRSGANLFEGNCRFSDQFLPRYSLDLLGPYAGQILSREAPNLRAAGSREQDQFFTRKAFQFMRTHPWRTLRLKLLNVIYLFHPRVVPFYPFDDKIRVSFTDTSFHVENLPSRPRAAEWIHTFYSSGVLFTAVIGIFLRRKEISKDWVLYSVMLSFVVVYSLYWPATRLRAPMDFILLFYSSVALNQWLPRA